MTMATTLLAPRDVAKRLGLSTSRIVQLDREGKLPALRDSSGPRRYDPETVERFAREGEHAADAGVGNTPHGPPSVTGNVTALQLAKKLLERGANPNVRVDWREPIFGKEAALPGLSLLPPPSRR